MIKKLKDVGLNITEQEYRDLDLLSYSVMSALDRDGPSSYGKTLEMTDAMLHGSIVDSMIDGSFNKEDYYISRNIEIGDGLKTAIDSYWEYQQYMSDFQSTDLSEHVSRMTKHLEQNDVDYYAKKSADWVAKKICADKIAQSYYKHLTLSFGKTLVTANFMDNCIKATNILKTHEFTKRIFGEPRYHEDAAYQFKFKFTVKNHEFKGMLDRIIIDHNKKTISPYDLKTGSKSALGFENSFFHWRYDLQALLYHIICLRLVEYYYKDYTVNDFKFIYIGRYENKPLIWRTTLTHLNGALYGFTRNNKSYKGLLDLIKDFEWYKRNQFRVEYPEKVYKNFGELTINKDNIIINYDKNRKK